MWEIKKMKDRLNAWLVKHGIIHRSLGFNYQGIETLQIKQEDWHSIAVILNVYGYNYLRCQCAYDVAPGHLTRIEYGVVNEKRARQEILGTTIVGGIIPNPEDAPESFRSLVREL
ncbi:hypothetical protein BUALT_Bualt14G0009700 [Buddleja alternifolia]|uniref:Uncharacterized protein n=1 Tax=Buddleja alternifolia TaxID=168488 RepID=A0AAV6WR26_9LAMI|nr:hypothetical protein BUALT_Bualt14G0009700 [Buddleja alternifolia]